MTIKSYKMKKNSNKIIITSGLSLLAMSGFAAEAQNESPNIIMIVVDDVGYADFACYGNTNHSTPNIDRLASQGAKFTDFHTNGPSSSPTRAALITGRYQQYAGIEGVITAASHRDKGLEPGANNSLASILKANNYKTAMFGKWHLGYSEEYNPIHHGFDQFVGYVSGNVDYFSHIDQEGYRDWWKQDKLAPEEGYSTYVITDYAERYIKKNKKSKKPFFLYIPHESAHAPWQGPNDEPLRSIEDGVFKTAKGREDVQTVYKEMIESLDDCVGRVMDAVEKAGISENTLILLFSDNGGAKLSNNAPFSGYKGSLLEGGHRVASIAVWKDKIKPGVVTDETVMTMDVMPTLCEVTNTSLEGVQHDGTSFWSTITEGKAMPERLLFWRSGHEVSVRDGNWKLRVNRKSRKGTLINLETDIAEKVNVWDQHPEVAERLLKAITEWEKNFTKQQS